MDFGSIIAAMDGELESDREDVVPLLQKVQQVNKRYPLCITNVRHLGILLSKIWNL